MYFLLILFLGASGVLMFSILIYLNHLDTPKSDKRGDLEKEILAKKQELDRMEDELTELRKLEA